MVNHKIIANGERNMRTRLSWLSLGLAMSMTAGLVAADPDPGGGNENPCECKSNDWDPGLSAEASPSEFVLDLATGQTIMFSAAATETSGSSGQVGPEDCEMPEPEIDTSAPTLDGWEHANGSGSSYELVIGKGECPPDSMTYEYSFSPIISESECPGVVGAG
jgi:hypothetical protein